MNSTSNQATEKPQSCVKPGRGGAPKGNTNAVRHGLTLAGRDKDRFSLKLGQLPNSLRRVEHVSQRFRRLVEQACIAAHGGITLTQAALINSAARWERHAQLAGRWLTREHDNLTPDQRVTFSREIARASSERDKCIQALKLDRDPVDDGWASLYAGSVPALAAETPVTDDATDGTEAPQDAAESPQTPQGESKHPEAAERAPDADSEPLAQTSPTGDSTHAADTSDKGKHDGQA